MPMYDLIFHTHGMDRRPSVVNGALRRLGRLNLRE